MKKHHSHKQKRVRGKFARHGKLSGVEAELIVHDADKNAAIFKGSLEFVMKIAAMIKKVAG